MKLEINELDTYMSTCVQKSRAHNLTLRSHYMCVQTAPTWAPCVHAAIQITAKEFS